MARLYVSDLDGTLLDAGGRLAEETRNTLEALLNEGLLFTVATARSIHSLAPILDGLPLSLPVIELNGAAITDLGSRRSVGCHLLPPQVAEDVVSWARAANLPPFLFTYVDGEQQLYPPEVLINAGMASYLETRTRARDPRLRAPRPASEVLSFPIVLITLIAREEELAPILLQLNEAHPNLTAPLLYADRYSGWHWLTVQSSLATKDRALRDLAERCVVSMERVTVFGDEVNDIPMFRAAGHAVAVENAVEELKRVADEVIGPHHEHSVARYLARAAR